MQKVALIILDWFGINNKKPQENAITQANTPTFDRLFNQPYASLLASWKAVWVPEWQMGNSEIGHLTIWSGRIIKQSLVEIEDLLDDWSWGDIPEFQGAIQHCIDNDSNLHLIQVLWPGWVHGSDSHLRKIIKIIDPNINVNLHLLCDGRDLEPQSAYDLMVEFQDFLKDFPNVKISTIWWRYFGMDRDNNRDRIQKAYDEIVFWQMQTSDDPSDYIKKSYEKWINDEFIIPVTFIDGDQLEDGDAVIHLNFRSDRARQLTQAISASIDPDLLKTISNRNQNFMIKKLNNIYLATMTRYYPEYKWAVIIKDMNIKNTLGEVLSKNEARQLHIAETEKFAHVTKFFNGGKQIVYNGEKDILVPSHKVATYDLDPEMSAQEIYDEFVQNAKDFDFVVVNFANWDMVGHTWVMSAAIQAVEKLDQLTGQLIDFCKKNNLDMLITADHGNCEEMWTQENPQTAHSTNPVPCRYIKNWEVQKIKPKWWLSDIAPTVLKLMNIEKASEMTWNSLV